MEQRSLLVPLVISCRAGRGETGVRMAGFAPPIKRPTDAGRSPSGPPWAAFAPTWGLAAQEAPRVARKAAAGARALPNVSRPSDPEEREAEEVAARVLEPTAAEGTQAPSVAETPTIHRRCSACDAEEREEEDHAPSAGSGAAIQRKGDGAPVATPAVEAAIGAMNVGGEALRPDDGASSRRGSVTSCRACGCTRTARRSRRPARFTRTPSRSGATWPSRRDTTGPAPRPGGSCWRTSSCT